jgi:hypothetical protein
MSKQDNNNLVKEEASVVTKVAKLMETIDEVRKYEVLDKHFRKFAFIVISSIIVLVIVRTYVDFFNLFGDFGRTQRFFLTFLLVVIPVIGFAIGMLFIRSKIRAVKTGEWKNELSNGFPSALKLLSEMNWDRSFDAVSSGGLGYAMYSLVKGVAYWVITYFTLGFAFNITTLILLNRTAALGNASLWFSLLITYVFLRNDLSRRFNDIRALDKLHGELRRFSDELRTAEI